MCLGAFGGGERVLAEEREKKCADTQQKKKTLKKIIKIAERRYSSKKTVFGKAKSDHFCRMGAQISQ